MQITELAKIIRECGVVGAGGAGFPSYGKLNKAADTVILNCAECEPLLKLHRQVLEKYAYEIMKTLTVIAEAVEADSIIIAIKKSYKDAVEKIRANLDSFGNIRMEFLPEVYPAGDEVITIYETTGRVVPPGKIPISVGVTVFNVETVYNIYRAINDNAPVTHKFVTVAGEVKNPVTLKVPLGMTLKDAVKEAGGITDKDSVYFVGGPMTGRIGNPYEVVTKTTNAILIMPKEQYIIKKRSSSPSIDMKRAMASCCQCQMCTDMCPRFLLGHPIEPHLFMRNATSGITYDTGTYLNTMFCCQCGLCEFYSCSQGLSPKTLIGVCKDELRKNGIKMPQNPKIDNVKEERNYRRVPMKRLIARLGLSRYDVSAPLDEREIDLKEYKIPLSQGIGAPAQPVVNKGDEVSANQVIAKYSEDKLGVSVHAPSDGTVSDVTDKFIIIKK